MITAFYPFRIESGLVKSSILDGDLEATNVIKNGGFAIISPGFIPERHLTAEVKLQAETILRDCPCWAIKGLCFSKIAFCDGCDACTGNDADGWLKVKE